jgi:hypothetical protein
VAYSWVRRNYSYICYTSYVSTCHRAALVYLSDKDPAFDPGLKAATERINEILNALMEDNKDRERQLSLLAVPDPTDKSKKPGSVLMLAWTYGGAISSEDDATTFLQHLPLS